MNKKIPLWKKNIIQMKEMNMQISETCNSINPKEQFRIICEEHIPHIRNIDLPVISQNNIYEAVLIEYRCFPHLEFLIRNAIIKLGEKWSHSIVCGTNNYEYMLSMCANISPEITVIKTEYDNLNQSTYSMLLASKKFWELFAGEKILLYQEDSCIFKSNVEDFLQWDYIGAPWTKTQNDTPNCVGNGGLSLRTKQRMIDIIERISIEHTEISSHTIAYMKNAKMTICPEDVYFAKNMQTYNLGRVADWDSASEFSTELIYNENSFGGHNFWLNDGNWMNRVRSLCEYDDMCRDKMIEFEYINYLNSKYNCVCVASPYAYTLGGGEKYLSFLMKYFLRKNYKIIFFTISDINTTSNTLRHYHNDNELSNIFVSDYKYVNSAKINTIHFKYFVFMYNKGIIDCDIQISASTKIFHCQFPCDYELSRNEIESYKHVSFYENNNVRNILNAYQHIIVNSEYTKDSLIEHYKTYDYFTENINILYPPCIQSRSNEIYNKTENTFIMVGRMFDYYYYGNNKYFDVAISIFNELCNYDYKLIIIASVKSFAYYERLMNMIKDKNKIIILPDISDEEKNKYLQTSKYYIQLTGINDKYAFNKEHFGISMVEAINNGCIPISCNAGYPKYLIENNVNGYLVDTQSSLKELVVDILEDRATEIMNTIDIDKFTYSEFFKNMNAVII
jgi:glycosyltransferase involved in cell wall biosynthesis